RGGSPAARGKRVNFARINTPVINLYESVQKECLGIPIFKPYREKLDTYKWCGMLHKMAAGMYNKLVIKISYDLSSGLGEIPDRR
ncbi:hypothetical protein GWJ21_12185, partial [Bacillus coagulans]|uniref:hypothetical protein n=1 Tax=Heyndrickxia coagulans TaxID=1398 RepID=UPI001F18F03B